MWWCPVSLCFPGGEAPIWQIMACFIVNIAQHFYMCEGVCDALLASCNGGNYNPQRGKLATRREHSLWKDDDHCHWWRSLTDQDASHASLICHSRVLIRVFRDKVLPCWEPISPSLTGMSSPSWLKNTSHFAVAGFTTSWKSVRLKKLLLSLFVRWGFHEIVMQF